MNATVLNESGSAHTLVMGCYGIGVSRIVAAAIEQNHDDDGIIWPKPLAPFTVLLIALDPKNEEVSAAADKLYGELQAKGIDVLYDDRKERPGVKFKDADLIGIPVRAVIGKRGLTDGKIEISERRDREKHLVDVSEALAKLVELAR